VFIGSLILFFTLGGCDASKGTDSNDIPDTEHVDHTGNDTEDTEDTEDTDTNCPNPCTSELDEGRDFCAGDTLLESCDADGNDVTWLCNENGVFVEQSTFYGCTTSSEPNAGTRVCPGEFFTRSCWPISGGQARVDWQCDGGNDPTTNPLTQFDEDYCTASSGPEAGQNFCPGEVIVRDSCSSGGARDHYICPESADTESSFVLKETTSCSIETEEWEWVHRGLRLKRWTTGVHRLRALEVDLCDASLRVGATESSHRGQTTSSWGASQGMLAAVNGGYYLTNPTRPDGCVAFGGGSEWSDSADTDYRSFLAIGPGNIGFSAPGYVETPPYTNFPWMEEAVCGGFALVYGGVAQSESSNTVRSRTGAGYTSDGKTLYLLTVDENGSTGMTTTEFAAALQGLGADFGINLDGGGSTTMWTDSLGLVNVPSGSERSVANHLGIWLEGGTEGYNCP
jgi:hypothetical protein